MASLSPHDPEPEPHAPSAPTLSSRSVEGHQRRRGRDGSAYFLAIYDILMSLRFLDFLQVVPDLVIIEVSMFEYPVLDGEEVCEILKA
ncbi:hypothetical protein BRADI_3g52941v3 [Brachypodium distachyon]|uniref:Uncharacterized protein n=1 Tax=Brachypodium distachyon TaxID=15368 RepID=A0A0Q3I524_BRADI|nr:hypothetical protein BRADI_3g52941v3 [Brachypodium distachyon]